MNTQAIQSATSVLSENLSMYRDQYTSKADFVSSADQICNQFPDEPSRLSKDDNEAIASKVWDVAADKADQEFAAWDAAHG